jgi:hypothetical protein
VPVTAARIHPKPAGGERRAELVLLNHSRPTRHDNQQEVNRDAELGLLNHTNPTQQPAGGERDAELGFLNHTNPTQQPAGGERDAELGFLNRAAVGGAEHD